MNKKKNSKPIKIPSGLEELLVDFVVETINVKPKNLVNFASDYFNRLKKNHEKNRGSSKNSIEITCTNKLNNFNGVKFSIVNESSTDSKIFKESELRMQRKSVSAEPYNPEADKNYKKFIFKKSIEDKRRLKELISSIGIFKSLDDEQLIDIVNAMQPKNVEADEIIIRQGAEGDYFYVIESGIFEAYTDDGFNRRLYDNNGYFGELALLYNQPRAANVIVKTKGKLWCVDRDTFRHIVLQNVFIKRQLYEKILKNCDLLKHLTSYERTMVADALMSRKCKDGERIIKQNDRADCMYFVLSGEVLIYIESKELNTEKHVKTCKYGDYFGELALLNNRPRAASAYAKGSNVTLAVLSKDAFERLIGKLVKKK